MKFLFILVIETQNPQDNYKRKNHNTCF